MTNIDIMDLCTFSCVISELFGRGSIESTPAATALFNGNKKSSHAVINLMNGQYPHNSSLRDRRDVSQLFQNNSTSNLLKNINGNTNPLTLVSPRGVSLIRMKSNGSSTLLSPTAAPLLSPRGTNNSIIGNNVGPPPVVVSNTNDFSSTKQNVGNGFSMTTSIANLTPVHIPYLGQNHNNNTNGQSPINCNINTPQSPLGNYSGITPIINAFTPSATGVNDIAPTTGLPFCWSNIHKNSNNNQNNSNNQMGNINMEGDPLAPQNNNQNNNINSSLLNPFSSMINNNINQPSTFFKYPNIDASQLFENNSAIRNQNLSEDEIILVSRHLVAIYNYLKNKKKMESNKLITNWKKQICDVVCRSENSFKKILHSFYFFQAKEFVLLAYTANNVDNIYKQWKIFRQPLFFIDKLFNCGNANINLLFEDCMQSESILSAHQMLVIHGYIQRNSKNNNMYIPTCIAHIIFDYSEPWPVSLYCSIKRLFRNHLNSILKPEKNICQLFNINYKRLERLLDSILFMIGIDFQQQFSKTIEKLINKVNKECTDKYSSDKMGIMEYTNIIQDIICITHDNYALNMHCLNMLIPSYIQNILSKNNGIYNDLASELTKSQLKQIYKLFAEVNYTEANRLNDAFKKMLKQRK